MVMELLWIYSMLTEMKTCSMRQKIEVEKMAFVFIQWDISLQVTKKLFNAM